MLLKCFSGLGLIWIPQAKAGSISDRSVSMSRNSCVFELCLSARAQEGRAQHCEEPGSLGIGAFPVCWLFIWRKTWRIGVLADCKRAAGEFTNLCAVFSKQNKMCIKDPLIIWIQIKCSWDILSVCISYVCMELMYKLIL